MPQTPPAVSDATASPANADAASASSPKRRRNSLPGSKSYLQLVHDAIVALKDRTGSSQPAILKYLLAEHPQLEGPQLRSRVNQALKAGVQKERFTKIKSSYKISAAFKAKLRAAKRKSPASLQQKNAKRLQQLQKTLAPDEFAKAKKDLLNKEEAAQKKAQQRADRLKKRRFPMEDTRLHAEDKELGVKPPADVTTRPYLPYFWHLTMPLNHPERQGKTGSTVLTASKVDHLDSGSRGLVPDLLQVYHFFRGDVHFGAVPEFTLQQLVYATEQVVVGNAKRSRLVPPLLVHLFVTCLQILCGGPQPQQGVTERQLFADLNEYLLPALSPASWADVCYWYMDAMERYYCSVGQEAEGLPPLNIDLEYLLGVRDVAVVPLTPAKSFTEMSTTLPEGYQAYLGDDRGALFRAHSKLGKMDPWMLSAEEMMALLRALTDDVLANHPATMDDMAAREEEMHELLRAKRSADMKLRKVRLAFEGPPKKAKKAGDEKADGDAEAKEEEPFKPTATRKQFEAAKKAQEKASDAYEKGIQSLVARTEPVGYDRNFNAVYCFRHDPEILFVEEKRPPSTVASHLPSDVQFQRSSWHVIESSSLFDLFTSSLDVRGKRENELYEEMMGPPGSQQSLRRFLLDDVKETATKQALLKERESLQSRLSIARIKCDEEQGRRSGRLSGQAEEELVELEDSLRSLERKLNDTGGSVDDRDYVELTGLNALRRFEEPVTTSRRTRDKQPEEVVPLVPDLGCSKIYPSGMNDGSGLMGLIVTDLMAVEKICESLAPWDDALTSRSTWLEKMESAVNTWNASCPVYMDTHVSAQDGSTEEVENEDPEVGMQSTPVSGRRSSVPGSSAKKRRFESPSATFHSAPALISVVRKPLLELEQRVADLTYVAVAARDSDLADDNMSVGSEDNEEQKNDRIRQTWKKHIHLLGDVPTARHGQIRQLLVAAISAARKAHLPEVVSKLRSALLLYHPSAAFECKKAAVAVLESYGGYDEEEDDDLDEEVEALSPDETPMPSMISTDCASLVGCLEGSEDSSRSDWIRLVNGARTLSRLASLVSAFRRIADKKLSKIQDEREDLQYALKTWQREESRRQNRKAKSGKSKEVEESTGPSEVWANVVFDDEIVMAKAEDWPWWPARRSHPKDPALAETLSSLGRTIVALVGEMGGLRIVKTSSIRPFRGCMEADDENNKLDRDVRSQLDDCIAMARRVTRGLEKRS